MAPEPARAHAGTMTTTPPDAPTGNAHGPGDGGPRATREQIRDVGRLRRTRDDRKVAGVAGGLARHLDVDPVILRVAFVVLVFFGGAGLLLYGAAWLLVPEEGSDSATINLDERSRTFALAIVGALAVFALIGDSWGVFGFPWPVAVVALVALLILTRRGANATPPRAGTGVPATSQPTTWTAPTYVAPVGPPRNPRKRGPRLFWFTLALIALSEGVLGIVDLAGAPVADPAYPALAVGLTGVMLLVGAFWGRAGGLILLGLISGIGLAGATAAHEFDSETLHVRPLSAAGVSGNYDIGAGELVLDLSRVSDLAALDGRHIHLHAGVGRIEVIVPRGVDVEAVGVVSGPGHVVMFGNDQGGIDTRLEDVRDGGTDVPNLTIDAEMGVGEIEFRLAPLVPTQPNTPDTPDTPNTPNAPHSPRSHR
ncbi:MAG: PspC domain protein [Nocardioides sp.]|nr:PspC domain protein [Nocardioides sp.]